MDGTLELLELLRDRGWVKGNLRGVFHLSIGRTIQNPDGSTFSAGVTWRELSVLLKAAKYDRQLVVELGVDPETLPPRDRERFWYVAIGFANVQSMEAREQADRIARHLTALGYQTDGVTPAQPKPASNPEPAPEKKTKRKK